MKASKVAAVVATLLATDAKPTEAQILAVIIAADKKGKDGEGPEFLEKSDKAKDKAKDEKDDPEKTNDEFPEKDDKAKDEKDDKAEDEDDVDGMDDEQPSKSVNGNEGKGGKTPAVDKKGMDSAIASALAARDALHVARRDVEQVVGVVAFDSAAEVYKAALDKLGVATDGVDASAFPVLFKLAREKVEAQTPAMAADAARVSSMVMAIPGYGRLK